MIRLFALVTELLVRICFLRSDSKLAWLLEDTGFYDRFRVRELALTADFFKGGLASTVFGSSGILVLGLVIGRSLAGLIFWAEYCRHAGGVVGVILPLFSNEGELSGLWKQMSFYCTL